MLLKITKICSPLKKLHIIRRCSGQKHQHLTVEKSGIVTLIGINRPEVRNCINSKTASELKHSIEDFERDNTSPIAVLYGHGGNFSAGFDLKELTKDKANLQSIATKADGVLGPTRRSIAKPVIGALSGYCVAGGMELALMCDLRVMEEDAILGFFNRRFGVPLIDGGTARLGHLIGLSRALDLILTGRKITAKEALDFGLVNRVVANGTSLGQAVNLANSIAKFPQRCMLHDRNSLFHATYQADTLVAAMQFEVMTVDEHMFEESIYGAKKFVNDSVGRGGKFTDIKTKDLPDWEKKEIEMEDKNKKK